MWFELLRSGLFIVVHSVGVLLFDQSWDLLVDPCTESIYLFFFFWLIHELLSLLMKLVLVLKISPISMPSWQLCFEICVSSRLHTLIPQAAEHIMVCFCELYLDLSVHDMEPQNFIVTCRLLNKIWGCLFFNMEESFFNFCILTQVCLVGHKPKQFFSRLIFLNFSVFLSTPREFPVELLREV